MKILDAIYVICLRDLKRFIRDRPRILGAVAMPALWLIIMGTGFNQIFNVGMGNYTHFMFPGIIAMTTLFTSVFSSASVIWDKQFGFMKEILVAPIPRTSIALGKSLSGSIQSLIQTTIMMGFSPIIGLSLHPTTVLYILVIVLLTSFSLTSLGLFLASLIDSHEGFNVIINFIVMPMFFLSGALFPITGLPTWMKTIVVFDPLTYGVDMLRGVITGGNVYPLFYNFSVLALFATAMTSLAVYSINKMM